MHHPRRRGVTTSMVGLKTTTTNKQTNKQKTKQGHTRKNLTQHGEPQRYTRGTQTKKKKKKKKKKGNFNLICTVCINVYAWRCVCVYRSLCQYVSVCVYVHICLLLHTGYVNACAFVCTFMHTRRCSHGNVSMDMLVHISVYVNMHCCMNTLVDLSMCLSINA